MSDHFVTEFGHRIPFVPGFYERHKSYIEHLGTIDVRQKLKRVAPGDFLPANLLLRDWISFSGTVNFMERLGLAGRTYGSSVDLGGAEGTIARLFNAYGLVDEASNVDLIDFSARINESLFRSLVDQLNKPGDWSDDLRKFVTQARKDAPFPLNEPVITTFKNVPKIKNAYLMNMLDTPGTYDLVTAYAAIDYVGVDELLAKVYSLLNPGGVFVAWIQMWWWTINTTGIAGHFPYAGQRLSFSDLKRYTAEHHPNVLSFLESRYHYFHKGEHPTALDWVARGEANGLELVGLQRLFQEKHKYGLPTPSEIFQEPWFKVDEVLRDIHPMAPQVTEDDLKTQSILIAFKKP